MWAAYHLFEPADTALHPEMAPAIVAMWRRTRSAPAPEGMRRRESVRKMQLEAAPIKM
ncbi:hypothetical protein Hanom_Chr12g01077101 [Helianthus anomalus]